MNVIRTLNCNITCRRQHRSIIQCLQSYQTRYSSSDTFGTKPANKYDIVVAGGGITGCAMVAALGANKPLQSKKILLIEGGSRQAPISLNRSDYSNRVSTLSPSSRALLKDVGAWETITNRCSSVDEMYVWESCSSSFISFSQGTDTEPLAHVVENDVIVSALTEIIHNCSNVDVLYDATVESYNIPSIHSTPITINLKNQPEPISTRLLIGADGFKSMVRQTCNIHTYKYDYKQFGVVSTLKLSPTQTGRNNTAWQRFSTTGPIALLPLNEEYSSLVWSTSPQHAKELCSMPEDEFVDSLNEALTTENYKDEFVEGFIDQFYKPLSKTLSNTFVGSATSQNTTPPLIIGSTSRAAFPYGLMHADNYVAPRVALIGDAAHRIHPLAGQGANLGLGDVSKLKEVLEKAVMDCSGSEIGCVDTLSEYERDRQLHNMSLTAGIHGLQLLYSTSLLPVVLARSIGLSVVNQTTSIKNMFMKMARYG